MAEPRRNPPLSKKFGKKTSGIEVPEGLNDVERKEFLIANGVGSPEKLKTDERKSQTVSRLKHEEEVGGLKEKLRRKEEKIGELNRDRDCLREERDSYRSRWEKARSELEEEQKASERYREQLRRADNDISSMKKDIERLSGPPAKVQVPQDAETKKALKKAEKSLARLNDEVGRLREEIARLTADNAGKASSIERLNAAVKESDEKRANLEKTIILKDEEIEALKSRTESPPEPTDTAASLVRKNANDIFSEAFEDGNYEVRLARNGSYMLIVPDVEGTAICRDHTITLPRLGDLVPFSEETVYRMNPVGNNVFRVELKR